MAWLANLVLLIAGAFRSRAALVAENLLLRQQLIVLSRGTRRPQLRRSDRFLLAFATRLFPALVDAIAIVKPRTVIGWHRALWKLLWQFTSRRAVGRPAIDTDLRALIRRL